MSARAFEVFREEFAHNLRRPLFWFQILLLGFFVFELSTGEASMQSGDARVGGTKAWITSEFAVTQLMIMMVSIIYSFFVSVGAGMALIRDHDQKVVELLHSTRMTAGEYVWGKYAGLLASFLWVLAMQLALMMLFNHVMPHGTNKDSIGPFLLLNYLKPALLFAVPMLILTTGVSLAVGGLTRNGILVFVLPVAVLLFGAFFLWEWSPSWLALRWNRVLQFVDLAGLRWINETWLNVDKGVEFYNKQPVGLDLLIIGQRLLCVVLGLGSVALLQSRVAAQIRGAAAPRTRARKVVAPLPDVAAAVSPAPLSALAMRSGAPSFLTGAFEVAGVEWRELWKHPGLYLFIPMILLQVFGSVVQVSAFDTPILNTPGILAVGNMNTLTLLVCMLILFYTVESLQREKSSGLAPVLYATPLKTTSMLLGKCIANTAVGVAVIITTMAGCAIVLAIQGKVAFDIMPFAITWGLLLIPTFLLWTAFTCAAFAVTGNRYGSYIIGLAAMSVTGFLQARDKMNWAFNWDLWSAVRWSDISVFELDRPALVLNRVMALAAALFFVVLTVRLLERRERDATRIVHSLRPAALGRTVLAMVPFAILPLACGISLYFMVHGGREGEAAKKLARDYWKKNIETWKNSKSPVLSAVDLDLEVDPARGWLKSKGEYTMVNKTGETLPQVPITGGLHWKNVKWTMNGKAYQPEDRAHLFVFTPDQPLAPGEKLRVGFEFDGNYPDGISKNGGGTMEYILPSGVVMTGFVRPVFAPIIGFQDEVGIEKDKNQTDPRVYPADYYKQVLPAALPMFDGWTDTHIRVTGPEKFQQNATGEKIDEKVVNGKRITEWKSDAPVRAFNVVFGQWEVKRAPGVAVYYNKKHPYNVDEMVDAVAGARKYFGEWFAPYPYKELRVSEFAGMASYAQGPPTNITFSETIGFLTKSEPKANASFWVTAHEAAHQWWPCMAMPGQGPGGDLLSEGMAHFSTILLTEQVRGLEQRIAFCKSIEDRYDNQRQRDSERPMTEIDGTLPGDRRVMYDRGGFVFWMLHRLMGRDANFAAHKEYMALYRDSQDHPLLQDYFAVMRRHAPDTTAFDAYVKQWAYGVAVPQYQITSSEVVQTGTSGWQVVARIKNVGTGVAPIEIAATRGERFPKKRTAENAYSDARGTVLLAAGEEKPVTIVCKFEPQNLVVDPDVTVLMLERQKAEQKLKVKGDSRTLAMR